MNRSNCAKSRLETQNFFFRSKCKFHERKERNDKFAQNLHIAQSGRHTFRYREIERERVSESSRQIERQSERESFLLCKTEKFF